MGQIHWIEDSLEALDREQLKSLMDTDDAIRIAREEELGIELPSQQVTVFAERLPSLFDWFGDHYRDFPWRRTRDPWAIIVAEILLQRTHATSAAEVYDTFLARFPDVHAVAAADSAEVSDTIDPVGLGTKKTRTLTTLAETLVTEYNGQVPNDLETLQTFPRIGPYTSRACLCFAYGRPLALVDPNIATVAEHAFRYGSPRRPSKDDNLYAFLDALIPKEADAARIFNLALLDLRVVICATGAADSSCPLNAACRYTAADHD